MNPLPSENNFYLYRVLNVYRHLMFQKVLQMSVLVGTLKHQDRCFFVNSTRVACLYGRKTLVILIKTSFKEVKSLHLFFFFFFVKNRTYDQNSPDSLG